MPQEWHLVSLVSSNEFMITKKKHVNIPVFIPHLGCPNMCVFCNQRTISGVEEFDPDTVIADIKSALSTIDINNTEIELAFFGGSFTGIDRSLMIHLLEIGQSYLDRGLIHSMRCSTRPDYVNDYIISVLKKYGMSTVELGIQSMDDNVLAASCRGHFASVTRDACRAVLEGGLSLVGQMMIGLPGATVQSEVECAEFISECGATAARVYPTVVFRGTELCSMSERGEYTPLSIEQAVDRTRAVLDIFDRNNIKVIRVGLCSSDNLSDDSQVYAGANDASIGEMAMSALYLDRIYARLDQLGDLSGKQCVIFGGIGSVSKISGHRRKNKLAISEKYGIKSVKILEKKELMGYNVLIDVTD